MKYEKKALTVNTTTTGRYLKVFINDLPHVVLELKEIDGFQSWKHSKDWYCIEYYMKNNSTVLCEYDSYELWINILKQLNEAIV